MYSKTVTGDTLATFVKNFAQAYFELKASGLLNQGDSENADPLTRIDQPKKRRRSSKRDQKDAENAFQSEDTPSSEKGQSENQENKDDQDSSESFEKSSLSSVSSWDQSRPLTDLERDKKAGLAPLLLEIKRISDGNDAPCRALLKAFGAERVSELNPDHYDAFRLECEKYLEGTENPSLPLEIMP